MSITDTTEYWWGIKERINNGKKVFVHLKGFDCGHFHVHETNKLIQVDCYSCLDEISRSPELKNRLEQSKRSEEERVFRHGKCQCGKPMCKRINKSTGKPFLGCSGFPICKNTSNIIGKQK